MFKVIRNYSLVSIFIFQFAFLSFFYRCEGAESQDVVKCKDFFVLTIPKSGSHLILKMLTMLTNKKHVFPGLLFPQLHAFTFIDENPDAYVSDEEMEAAFATWKKDNVYPLAHFNFSENFQTFASKHPEYVKIIQIRDLRDACVACVCHQEQAIEQEIGPCNFDQKLMFIITLGDKPTKNSFLRIEKNARRAVEWIKDPDTVVCRFEDLVGKKGGGSVEAQRQQIVEIANHLNIDLSNQQLDWIVDNLFGVQTGPQIPSTFREGKVGSWRQYFSEEHKEAFREHFEELQLQLGYSLD
jgi:hypothetical protein